MKLRNKKILITGGTSGIGLEIVKKLADQNMVIVISRKGTLPEALSKGKYPVKLYHADIANKSSLESVMDDVLRNYVALDVLINNAAIQLTPEFLSDDFNYDTIQKEIDTNFTSVCHLTYLCLPLLQISTEAIILNVNSGLAIKPKKESAIYSATKSALNSFSMSLSYQLQRSSIHVAQVYLPLVETPMTAGRGSKKLQANVVAKEILAGIEKGKKVNDIGKVKILRLINYVFPQVAARVMMKSG